MVVSTGPGESAVHIADSILVGVDFSSCSASALRQALRLGRAGTVKPVYFLDTYVAATLEEALTPSQKDIRRGLIDEARAYWAEFRKGVDGASALELDVEIDNAVRAVSRRIAKDGADLLVAGERGAGDSKRGPGSFASGCVQHAPSDVLLVREGQHGPFRRVLACVDFSETSRSALQRAIRLARHDSAALDVVHVFTAPWSALHYKAPTPEATPQFRTQYTGVLTRRLESFTEGAGEPTKGLRVAHHLVESARHGAAIAQFAKEHGCDVVALGTRGRTNLRDVLLGSTAERVLRDAPCSIYAVKPPAAAD